MFQIFSASPTSPGVQKLEAGGPGSGPRPGQKNRRGTGKYSGQRMTKAQRAKAAVRKGGTYKMVMYPGARKASREWIAPARTKARAAGPRPGVNNPYEKRVGERRAWGPDRRQKKQPFQGKEKRMPARRGDPRNPYMSGRRKLTLDKSPHDRRAPY